MEKNNTIPVNTFQSTSKNRIQQKIKMI